MAGTNDLFETIIATILEDIIRAQHAANVFSARLAKKYIDPQQFELPAELGYFPVPNSVIKSFRFSLQFGLDQWPAGASGLLDALYKAVDDLISLLPDAAAPAGGWQETEPALRRDLHRRARGRFLSLLRDPHQSRAGIIDALVRDIPTWPGSRAVTAADEAIGDAIRRSLETHVPAEPYEGLDKPAFKAIFDLELLKETQNNLLCSLSFEVDLRNLQGGFREGTNGQATQHFIPIG